MRTLAIGDIHGCLTALETLLVAVDLREDDLLITLGDYTDRGPDSRGVLDLLISLWWQEKLVAVRGNHDIMFCDARDKHSSFHVWLSLGGEATLQSYGGNIDNVPQEHWDFLKNGLVDYYETKTHIFVHAGLWPDVPLDEQPEFVLFFERFHNPAPHESGKTMICGHTNQRSGLPNNKGHAVCIDTRAYGGGWLSCLHVETGRIWQANQKGEVRELWLDDLQ
ncbi:MAG TPA: metallophosphoesterase family protein [Abditibacteriaceae bacterium]|jgi:serine/threonine protein phosphatase 1